MMLMRKVNANCQKIITTCCAPSQCTSHQFKMYMYVKSETPMFSVLLLKSNYRCTIAVCAPLSFSVSLFLYFSCFSFSEHRYALWCNCISKKFHILNASIPLFISNEFTHLFVESLIHTHVVLSILCFVRMFVRSFVCLYLLLIRVVNSEYARTNTYCINKRHVFDREVSVIINKSHSM